MADGDRFAPPTPQCEGCRWWRERWARAWCARPGGHHEQAGRCEDFRRGGTDWAGLMTGNGETRR